MTGQSTVVKQDKWLEFRKKRYEGNKEWERLPTDLYLNICSCVCWCVGMQECVFVFGFCQFRLWSVTKVWLQIHWPQAHSHKRTLQITGHFSHNSAVRTSHSPETLKTMFPLGLPLNSIQCVYSAAVLTVKCLWDEIWRIVDFWISGHVHPVLCNYFFFFFLEMRRVIEIFPSSSICRN